MTRSYRIGWIVGLLLTVLFLMGSAGASQIVSTIYVEEPEQEAEVGPGQSGLVQFTGRVYCEGIGVGNNVQQILFSLKTDAGNWSASVSPSTMAFSATQTEQPFRLSVRAPPRTSYLEYQEVMITGQATPIPGLVPVDVNPTHTNVYIKQFYDVMVDSSSPYKELAPGKTTAFELRVHNEGNGFDSFNIDITNQKQLADAGWVVHVSASSVDIEERGTAKVSVSVTTPMDWTIWTNEISGINLKIVSEGSQMAGGLVKDEEYPFYCRMKGMYIPGFDIQVALFAVIVGFLIFGAKRRRN